MKGLGAASATEADGLKKPGDAQIEQKESAPLQTDALTSSITPRTPVSTDSTLQALAPQSTVATPVTTPPVHPKEWAENLHRQYYTRLVTEQDQKRQLEILRQLEIIWERELKGEKGVEALIEMKRSYGVDLREAMLARFSESELRIFHALLLGDSPRANVARLLRAFESGAKLHELASYFPVDPSTSLSEKYERIYREFTGRELLSDLISRSISLGGEAALLQAPHLAELEMNLLLSFHSREARDQVFRSRARETLREAYDIHLENSQRINDQPKLEEYTQRVRELSEKLGMIEGTLQAFSENSPRSDSTSALYHAKLSLLRVQLESALAQEQISIDSHSIEFRIRNSETIKVADTEAAKARVEASRSMHASLEIVSTSEDHAELLEGLLPLLASGPLLPEKLEALLTPVREKNLAALREEALMLSARKGELEAALELTGNLLSFAAREEFVEADLRKELAEIDARLHLMLGGESQDMALQDLRRSFPSEFDTTSQFSLAARCAATAAGRNAELRVIFSPAPGEYTPLEKLSDTIFDSIQDSTIPALDTLDYIYSRRMSPELLTLLERHYSETHAGRSMWADLEQRLRHEEPSATVLAKKIDLLRFLRSHERAGFVASRLEQLRLVKEGAAELRAISLLEGLNAYELSRLAEKFSIPSLGAHYYLKELGVELTAWYDATRHLHHHEALARKLYLILAQEQDAGLIEELLSQLSESDRVTLATEYQKLYQQDLETLVAALQETQHATRIAQDLRAQLAEQRLSEHQVILTLMQLSSSPEGRKALTLLGQDPSSELHFASGIYSEVLSLLLSNDRISALRKIFEIDAAYNSTQEEGFSRATLLLSTMTSDERLTFAASFENPEKMQQLLQSVGGGDLFDWFQAVNAGDHAAQIAITFHQLLLHEQAHQSIAPLLQQILLGQASGPDLDEISQCYRQKYGKDLLSSITEANVSPRILAFSEGVLSRDRTRILTELASLHAGLRGQPSDIAALNELLNLLIPAEREALLLRLQNASRMEIEERLVQAEERRIARQRDPRSQLEERLQAALDSGELLQFLLKEAHPQDSTHAERIFELLHKGPREEEAILAYARGYEEIRERRGIFQQADDLLGELARKNLQGQQGAVRDAESSIERTEEMDGLTWGASAIFAPTILDAHDAAINNSLTLAREYRQQFDKLADLRQKARALAQRVDAEHQLALDALWQGDIRYASHSLQSGARMAATLPTLLRSEDLVAHPNLTRFIRENHRVGELAQQGISQADRSIVVLGYVQKGVVIAGGAAAIVISAGALSPLVAAGYVTLATAPGIAARGALEVHYGQSTALEAAGSSALRLGGTYLDAWAGAGGARVIGDTIHLAKNGWTLSRICTPLLDDAGRVLVNEGKIVWANPHIWKAAVDGTMWYASRGDIVLRFLGGMAPVIGNGLTTLPQNSPHQPISIEPLETEERAESLLHLRRELPQDPPLGSTEDMRRPSLSEQLRLPVDILRSVNPDLYQQLYSRGESVSSAPLTELSPSEPAWSPAENSRGISDIPRGIFPGDDKDPPMPPPSPTFIDSAPFSPPPPDDRSPPADPPNSFTPEPDERTPRIDPQNIPPQTPSMQPSTEQEPLSSSSLNDLPLYPALAMQSRGPVLVDKEPDINRQLLGRDSPSSSAGLKENDFQHDQELLERVRRENLGIKPAMEIPFIQTTTTTVAVPVSNAISAPLLQRDENLNLSLRDLDPLSAEVQRRLAEIRSHRAAQEQRVAEREALAVSNRVQWMEELKKAEEQAIRSQTTRAARADAEEKREERGAARITPFAEIVPSVAVPHSMQTFHDREREGSREALLKTAAIEHPTLSLTSHARENRTPTARVETHESFSAPFPTVPGAGEPPRSTWLASHPSHETPALTSRSARGEKFISRKVALVSSSESSGEAAQALVTTTTKNKEARVSALAEQASSLRGKELKADDTNSSVSSSRHHADFTAAPSLHKLHQVLTAVRADGSLIRAPKSREDLRRILDSLLGEASVPARGGHTEKSSLQTSSRAQAIFSSPEGRERRLHEGSIRRPLKHAARRNRHDRLKRKKQLEELLRFLRAQQALMLEEAELQELIAIAVEEELPSEEEQEKEPTAATTPLPAPTPPLTPRRRGAKARAYSELVRGKLKVKN